MSPIEDIAFVRCQVTDLDRRAAPLADVGLHSVARTECARYSRTAGALHHARIAELGPEHAAIRIGFLARSTVALGAVAQRVGRPVRAATGRPVSWTRTASPPVPASPRSRRPW